MSIDYACILKGKVTFFGSYMKEYGFNENDKLYTDVYKRQRRM